MSKTKYIKLYHLKGCSLLFINYTSMKLTKNNIYQIMNIQCLGHDQKGLEGTG